MRSQTFSLVLVALLALSHYSNAQSTSQEYVKAISELVSPKRLGDATAISPLQTLYYTQLLQPGFLWRDLTTMILLGASTEYVNASVFMEHFSKSFNEKFKWSYTEPANTDANVLKIKPSLGPLKKEVNTDLPTSIKMGPVSETRSPEKVAAGSLNPKVKNPGTVALVKTYVAEMPSDFEWIKGADYLEYGSVGFYRNATIIHSSYSSEMASLAEHMKTDLNIKLRIHGHCNSDADRTIIAAGIMTKFFEISDQDQKRTVTAEELTELRASYAKRYLISQGISPERIQVIGQGAEKMIYSSTSEHAHYNDRIEFELIRNTRM